MASLLQSPLILSPSSSSSSSSSSSFGTCLFKKINSINRTPNLQFHELHRLTKTGSKPYQWSYRPKTNFTLRSAIEEVTIIDPPPPSSDFGDSKAERIASLKLKLLSAVSGLNRGLAATEDDLRKADAIAKEIEGVAGQVDLSVDIDKLQGRWKLIYSSAFSSRTLGGSRPGPPTGRLLPISLGQVFQRIDILSKDFDNIVDLQLGAPWPLPPIEATATLAHKFEVIGTAKMRIVFEKTTVKTGGNLSQLPPLDLPRLPDGLRPPSDTRSGEFEVTYLDSDTRITRGDRDELRVFVIS